MKTHKEESKNVNAKSVANNTIQNKNKRSGIHFEDNRPERSVQKKINKRLQNDSSDHPNKEVDQGKFEKPVMQMMLGRGFSMGADSGADNTGEFELEERRREAAERRQAAERRAAEIAAARRLITGNMQLSANRPAVLREFDELLAQNAPGTPREIAYRAMNNVMNDQPGSVNADREQHGGDRGFSRR